MLLLTLFSSSPLLAQRQYVIGTTVNVSGGGDNNLGSRLPLVGRTSDRMEPFWGVFPTIDFESRGARSSLNLNYAFGFQRTETDQRSESQTHSIGLAFTDQLSPRWSTSISNSFEITDDAASFYALRGILPSAEGYTLFFYPVAVDQTVRTNRTSVKLDHSLNSRSSLSFDGSFSLRNYGNDRLTGVSNQYDGTGSVSYSRKTSERTSWSLSYSGSYYQFDQFNDSFSNAVHFGMSSRIAEYTSFNWSVGGSQVRSRGGSSTFASYEASTGLTQNFKKNLIQLSVAQDNGSPSGIGSVSKSRRANVGVSRSIGRKLSLFANASVFDSKAILDNTYDSRGGSATANIGFALSRSFSLQVGGQYQRYTKPVIYAFTQKRLFLSLRYSQPNLWHSR